MSFTKIHRDGDKAMENPVYLGTSFALLST